MVFHLGSWRVSYLYFYRAIGFSPMVFLVILSVQSHAFAINIDENRVTEKDGIYHIYVSAEISADEKYVRQVLTDYVHVYRLNSSIVESKVFDASVDGDLEIQSVILFCTPIVCKEVKRVDVITTLDSGDLQAMIVPEKSDFRSGKAVWKITSMGNGTRLIYLAEIEPDFFVPPILGTNMVIDNMRDELTTTFIRIEKVAHIKEEREWGDDATFMPTVKRTGLFPCNNMLDTDR